LYIAILDVILLKSALIFAQIFHFISQNWFIVVV